MARKSSKRSKRGKSLGKRIGSAFNAITEAVEKLFKNLFGGFGKFFGMFASLLIPKSFTKKMDRATKKTSKKVGKRVGKITEQVEKRFTKGASGIFSTFGHIFRIFLPTSLTNWIAARWKAASKRVNKFFTQLMKGLGSWAERYLPAWMVNAGKAFSKRFKKFRRIVSKFNTAWWKSRDFTALAWSLPAFLLAIPLLSSIVLAGVYDRHSKINHYQRVMADSLQEEDYEKAGLCQKKLRQLDYSRQEDAAFFAATARAQNGNWEDAYAEMKLLAPLKDESIAAQIATNLEAQESGEVPPEQENNVYVPAHLWIAGAFWNGNLEAADNKERLRLIRAHVDTVLDSEPGNKNAKWLDVKYLLEIGEKEVAIRKMVGMAEDYPEFNGELMEFELNKGDASQARMRAARFIRYAQSVVDEKKLYAVDWAFWAKAIIVDTGNRDEATKIARRGLELFPGHPDIGQFAAAEVLASLASADPTSEGFIDLLCEAHEVDPENKAIINRIASRLTYEPFTVESKIERMKERKTMSPHIYLASGEIHLMGGRNAEAIAMFEQALEVDRDFAEAHNNLAWTMGNRMRPPQLEAAISAADLAIELDDRPEFRETRGQLHFQLDNLDLAIVDLEQSLNGILAAGDRVNAHRTLSLIYERRGKSELSQAHAARAESLRPSRL